MTDHVKELEELVRRKNEDSGEKEKDSGEKSSDVLKPVETAEGKGNEAWQKQMLEVQNLTLGVLNKIIKKITPTETNQKPQQIPAPPEKEQEAEKVEEQSSKVSRSILRQIW